MTPGGATTRLRLATRGSPLAMWQAEHVAGLLVRAHPGLTVEVVPTVTRGDRQQDVPISEMGGKGVFATEVQRLVAEGVADVAVHSAKDLPAVTPAALVLAAVPERGDPRDALVGSTLAGLPPGATVATGSQRRRVQLAAARPDLRFVELRGNMATRLRQVGAERDGEVIAAVIVAAAALQRLGWDEALDDVLPVEVMVPQVGQGALAVEARAGDEATLALLAAVEDPTSRRRLDAERAFLVELGGDCDLPAGCYADLVRPDDAPPPAGTDVRAAGGPAPGGDRPGGDAPDGGPALDVRAVLADPGGRLHHARLSGADGPTLGSVLARTLRAALAP